VGKDYDKWEGYKDAATGETKIGLSYPHLCQDVKVGGRILIGDGTVGAGALCMLSTVG
jgi:pyruvate kinase